MKCSKCQFDNRERAKFCKKCGLKLDLVCPSCGRLYEPDSLFCDQCGQRLSEAIEAEKKISSTEGERKHVTVLFSDLSGYTAITERLDLEDVKEIMNRIFGEIAQVVTKYEGFIERFIGDSVMAFFGVPKTHEDDAVRAIKAAREIHGSVEALSPHYMERVGQPLSMHTGINTGLVVTGEVNLEKGTHGIMGDSINLASRIVALAKAGEILVGEDTYRQAEGYFIFEPLESRRVKGKRELVNIYRMIAPSTKRTRFDVTADRGLSPFVGRRRELNLLLEGFERSKAGTGQSFCIVSEAGVGKSRLLYEFKKAVANEDVTFLEGKCLSYHRGVAYHPIIDVLKSNFGVREKDRDLEIKKKVRKGLKLLGAEESSTLPYILELLSVRDSGIDKIPMSIESRRDRIIEALKLIVLRGSEIRPLIVTFEDLHWADKGSKDVFRYVLESIPGVRVLMILTYRPEFRPSWGSKSFHSQVSLNRLSNEESFKMMTHLLGTEKIHTELKELVLEKTEGVPFFIEEFIKSLKDLQILERIANKYHLSKNLKDVTIPATIQDVIMARVDSLPGGPKEVLQTGSAIEREFSHELIKRVTGLQEHKLLSHISILKDSELLYERGLYPQSNYFFKHALTQDVVYDSILRKKKKKLHEEIGRAIEDLYGENIDEHYGVLVEHFIKSSNYEKGAIYSKFAAKKAQKAASFKDAIEYANKRIFCLEQLEETEEIQKRIIDARTLLAGYHMSLSHWFEAKEAVSPIIGVALKLNHERRLPGIYTAMGLYSHWVEEDISKTLEYLKEALMFSERAQDYVSYWFACVSLGCALSWNCEFERGFEYFKKALDMSAVGNNIVGISFAKGTMSAFNYIFWGKIDLAHQESKESLQIAKDIGDTYIKGMAFSSYGTSCYYKGLLEEAEECLQQGLGFCERIAMVAWAAWASGYLGHMYSDTGQYEKAKDCYEKTIYMLDRGSLLPSWLNHTKISKVRAQILNKDQDAELSGIFEYYKGIKVQAAKGWAERFIGEIFLNIDEDHMSDAEHWISKAIESDKGNGMMLHLGRDYALYADLLKRKGERLEGKENLIKAIETLKECGADGFLRKTEKELALFS
ncbi:MAG: adenylate/guanylate cyclase domain-containing protein [Pseudomonadota bacterium]